MGAPPRRQDQRRYPARAERGAGTAVPARPGSRKARRGEILAAPGAIREGFAAVDGAAHGKISCGTISTARRTIAGREAATGRDFRRTDAGRGETIAASKARRGGRPPRERQRGG